MDFAGMLLGLGNQSILVLRSHHIPTGALNELVHETPPFSSLSHVSGAPLLPLSSDRGYNREINVAPGHWKVFAQSLEKPWSPVHSGFIC
jgi:hypothetical protein